ncbi:hypothetical protein IWW50_005620, partial [Coemansia erecta]
EVNDLPLGAEPIPEQSEEDDVPADESPTAKRHADVDMAEAGSEYEAGDDSASEHGDAPLSPQPELMEIPSMASLQSTVKKKRKLHTARTVLDIGSPENEADDRMVGAPATRQTLGLASNTRVSTAAEPQEDKQPVLFTPVRTRSRNRPNDLVDDENARDKDSIFTTPMKMLSRLRNRKK